MTVSPVARSDQLLPVLEAYLRGLGPDELPDVVLLHIGSNRRGR